MYTSIKSSLKNIAWKLIHCRLLHPYQSYMKAMCHRQTLPVIPNQFPNKINKAPQTVYSTAKITPFLKCTTVDTTKFTPGYLLRVDFNLYYVTSIRYFTSMLTVVCSKKIIILLFSIE